MTRLSARLVAAAFACVVALALAPAAWASEGPQLGPVRFSPNFGATVATFDASGDHPAALLPASGQTTPVPLFVSPASWSGDGSFLIATAPAKRSDESASSESESVSVEMGTDKHVVHRTRTSMWIAHIAGGKPRQLTPWRTDGYDLLTSASPDGSTLAFTEVTYDRSKRPTRVHSEARFLNLRTGRSVSVDSRLPPRRSRPTGRAWRW